MTVGLASFPFNSDTFFILADKSGNLRFFRSSTDGSTLFVRPHTVSTRVLGSNSEAVVDSLNDVHAESVGVHSLEVRFLTRAKSVLEIIDAIVSKATD